MAEMNLVQLIAAQVEAQLYEKLHDLLGVIASDYELKHDELVERYLKYKNVVDEPKVIYKATEEVEAEAKPKSKPKRAAKVTQKKAESDEQAEEERKGKCQGKTAKGLPCKLGAQAGSCFCHIHKKKDESSDEETPKKAPRAKKVAKAPEAPKKRGRKAKAVEPVKMAELDDVAEEVEECKECECPEMDQEMLKREALRSLLAEELGQEDGEITDEMLEEFEAEIEKEDEEEHADNKELEEGEVAGEEDLD